MPRAYHPNLSTTQRARVACQTLGIKPISLARGPSVIYRDAEGRLTRQSLRVLEATASEYRRQTEARSI